MPDAQKFHDAMAKIMPIILQTELEKQRQARYLENNLKEYAAQEASQQRLEQQRMVNQVIQELSRNTSKFAEGQPFSPTTFVESLRGILTPELMAQLPIQAAQPGMADRTKAAYPALVRILGAQAQRVAPDPADLQTVAEAYGSEMPGNVVSDITQRQSEEEARKLGYKQLERQTAETGIRAGNLELRKDIAGKTVDQMKSAELRTLIGTYQTQQKQIQARIADLYTPEEDKPALTQQLTEIAGRLDLATNVLEQKILAQEDKSPKEYNDLLNELKRRGLTRQDVVNNIDLRRQLLIQGYSVTKILGAWK